MLSGVKFTLAPIGAPPGFVPRPFVGPLPVTAKAVFRRLSKEAWRDKHVTDASPARNTDGCVAVQKVYYRCGGDSRRSFTSPTTFIKFLDYVSALKPGSTIDLLLWDDSTSTAPNSATSTPTKGEMDCFDCLYASPYVRGWLHAAPATATA